MNPDLVVRNPDSDPAERTGSGSPPQQQPTVHQSCTSILANILPPPPGVFVKVIVRVREKVEMKKRERGKKGKLAEIEKKICKGETKARKMHKD